MFVTRIRYINIHLSSFVIFSFHNKIKPRWLFSSTNHKVTYNMVSLTKYPAYFFAFSPSLHHFLLFLSRVSVHLFFLYVSFMVFNDEASNHEFIHDNSLTNKSTRKYPATDPWNPYYVHPQKNPSVVLVTPPLDDHN